MKTLRPYQHNYINETRNRFKSGAKRVITCAPTGAGKTFIFSNIITSTLEKGKKCLVLSHRTELLTQTDGSLSDFGHEAVHINPKNKKPELKDGSLFLSMSQTLSRRIKKPEYKEWIKTLDLIVIDEAHTQDSDFIWDYLNDSQYVIGATATPVRKGAQKSLHEMYDGIVECVTVEDLVDSGFLSTPDYYMDDSIGKSLSSVKKIKGDYDQKAVGDFLTELKIYDGVIENYKKYSLNQKTLIFSSSIESSEVLRDEFIKAGFICQHLDYKCSSEERKNTLKWFKETDDAILTNVGILTAGFDEPSIRTIILYRATTSLPLYLQMVGRGSRTTEHKKRFNVLDFGTNISRLGTWHQSRKWKLIHKHKKGVAPIKECPSCMSVLSIAVNPCNFCGHFFVNEKEEEERELIMLKKFSYEDIKKTAAKQDFETLEKIAKAKGYKKGWVLWQLKDADLLDYAKYKKHRYPSQWVKRILDMRYGRK